MSVRYHQSIWPVAALSARLADFDVVLCSASLLSCGGLDEALAVMSATERSRHTAYANVVVARRYACGRALLRGILGSALGVAPADVQLRDGLHGKPYLAGGTSRPVWFSLSHCDELLVVAMSRKCDVGVDIERSRAFEQWERVADRVLDDTERAQLASSVERGEDPSEAFLRLWCRVEAELKAIGCGINGLEAHRAGERPRGLRLTDLPTLPLPGDVVALGVRYQAAVALCPPGAEMRRQTRSDAVQATTPATSPARTSTP